MEVVGFFFNPNIHPYLEFRRRLENVRTVSEQRRFPLLVDDSYDPVAWFQQVGIRGADRCRACISLRLSATARRAAAEGMEAFSTTLAISPWQDHVAIAEMGRAAAEEHGPAFLYEDLRPLYKASVEQSRELGLYRQKYCGCILSEWERFRDAGTVR